MPECQSNDSHIPLALKTFILKVVLRIGEKRGLLNAGQFGFRARHSMAHHFMRPTFLVTWNFSRGMSTAAVFFYTYKTCDITWNPDMLL
jgi:hypothetical protein